MVELTVLEAYGRDVGRGIARIDYDEMDLLKIKTGDTIRISKSDEKWTIVRAMPLYPSDEGKHLIRIDRIIRENGGVTELNQKVNVESINVDKIETISLEPVDNLPPNVEESIPRILVDHFDGQCMKNGDSINSPWFGKLVSFKVGNITSKNGLGYGIVTPGTIVTIRNKTTSELTRAEVIEMYNVVLETKRGIDLMEHRLDAMIKGWKPKFSTKSGHRKLPTHRAE